MAVAKKRNIRRSVGFDKKEMEGYFMIANKDAAIAIVNKLTGSQLRLWLYLMMVDSFADLTTNGEKVYHSIPSPQEIAIKIGVSPETVEKDIRKLKKLGLYEYRITAWQGHNLSAAKAKEESDRLKKKKAETKSQQSEGLNKPPERLNKPPERLNKPPERLNKPPERLNKPPENPETTEKSSISGSPQTIQTYTDFKQTLSEGERENFLKFVEKKIENLEKPINDLEAWLASETKSKQNRWEVYYQNYQREEGQKTTRQNPASDSAAREEKKLAIKNWQEYLKQQRLKNQQTSRTKKDVEPNLELQQQSKAVTDLSRGNSDPWDETHSSDISLTNSGEASPSQESEKDLKEEIDQILNGFSKVDRDALEIPPEKPERNLSQKMNEGLQYLRGMGVTKYKSEIENQDMGGEAK